MNSFLKYAKRIIVILFLLIVIGTISYYKKDISVDTLIKKYCDSNDRFMPLMGMKVHYRDEGYQVDSTPLVLIHGTASSLFTWDSSAMLLNDKHRIIRFDLPAFGITGPSPDREYSIEYYTYFLDSFLIRLNIKHCILIGNSLGGNIAWRYCLHHPENVSKLVLVDPSGMLPTIQPKGAIGFKIAQMPIINTIAKYITPKTLVKKSLEDSYGNKTKIKDALVDRYFDFLVREGNREALIDRLKFSFVLDETAKIMQIKTPTLIVWGDKDQLIPVEKAYRFNKVMDNSELSIMKGIGHVPMEEDPTAFAETVGRFIDKK